MPIILIISSLPASPSSILHQISWEDHLALVRDVNPIRNTHFLPLSTMFLVRAFPLLILTQPFVSADSALQSQPTTEENISLYCVCAEQIQSLVIIP